MPALRLRCRGGRWQGLCWRLVNGQLPPVVPPGLRTTHFQAQSNNGETHMAISMYQASVPVFTKMMNAVSHVIDKAEAHCAAKKIDPQALLTFRLYPDMFPLSRQFGIATVFGSSCPARLAGAEILAYDDKEASFADWKARIKRTVEFAESFKPAQIDGSEDKDIKLTVAGNPVTLKGQPYLTHFALPHFFFHCATAYDILRHNGVEVGKRDYLGKVPGM